MTIKELKEIKKQYDEFDTKMGQIEGYLNDGSNVDFVMNHKKCINCSSDSFEDSIVEPERSIYVDLPNITHNAWMSFTDGEKKERIKQEEKIINAVVNDKVPKNLDEYYK